MLFRSDTLKTIIESGKNVVDISFFGEDALTLDDLAIKMNVTAIVDCGVAPGMGNMILGYHCETMQVENFECLVGGLPLVRKLPFQYKAPFSPIDVIEEYIRPARYVENGNVITKPALSDSEMVDFDEIGTLESFNTDGLRSLIKTMKIPNMKEKTLRFPGHIDLIKALKSAGFFSSDFIEIENNKIRPIDVTCKILFDQWKLSPEEEEFTVMRVTIEGIKDGQRKKIVYNLLDRYDKLKIGRAHV